MRSIKTWHLGTLIFLFAMRWAAAQTSSELERFQQLTGLPASFVDHFQPHPTEAEQRLFYLKNGMVCWIDDLSQRFALARSGALKFPRRARLLDLAPPSSAVKAQAKRLWEALRQPGAQGVMRWEVELLPQGKAYRFRFEEQIPFNRALTGNLYEVSLTPEGERIDEISRIQNKNLKNSPMPQLNLKQALQKAMETLPNRSYLDHRAVALRWEQNRLEWCFQLRVVDDSSGTVARYQASINALTGQAHLRKSPVLQCAQPPRHRLMIAQMPIDSGWGPWRIDGRWYVSAQVVEVLGGHLIRATGGAELIGDNPLVLKSGEWQERGGKVLVCAFAVQRAFPKTLALMQWDVRRGALNLICDRESMDLWQRENNLVYTKPVSQMRANAIQREVASVTASQNPPVLNAILRSEAEATGHNARGWWIGLFSLLFGMALITRRKRRRWFMRHV